MAWAGCPSSNSARTMQEFSPAEGDRATTPNILRAAFLYVTVLRSGSRAAYEIPGSGKCSLKNLRILKFN